MKRSVHPFGWMSAQSTSFFLHYSDDDDILPSFFSRSTKSVNYDIFFLRTLAMNLVAVGIVHFNDTEFIYVVLMGISEGIFCLVFGFAKI